MYDRLIGSELLLLLPDPLELCLNSRQLSEVGMLCWNWSADRNGSMSPKSRLGNPQVERLEARWLLAAHVLGSRTAYPTIQAAVNAAPAGGTVWVDPGTYSELVTVDKSLTLLGARAGVDGRDSARDPHHGGDFRGPWWGHGETIVNGQDFGGENRSTSFYITANDVTIDGFTVKDDTSSNVYGAGIVIAPGVSGTHIQDNVIEDNVAGLYLANSSSTDPAIIRRNVFASNNNPGNNNGRGIYTDGGVSGGNLTNVLIDSNIFYGNVGDGTSGNPEAAIGLEAQTAGKQSNLTISNNVMAGNGKGVLMYNVTGVKVTGNFITGSTDAASGAIRIEGNVSNALIAGNTVWNNQGAAVRISPRFVGPSSNITINYNNFVNNAGGGLVVDNGGYTGTLDARYNYWGSPSGPGGDGPGTGDAVTANDNTVNFTPWSRWPILSVFGFQFGRHGDAGDIVTMALGRRR